METRNQDTQPCWHLCRWSAATGSALALGHAVVAGAAEGTPAEAAACGTAAGRMPGAVPHTVVAA